MTDRRWRHVARARVLVMPRLSECQHHDLLVAIAIKQNDVASRHQLAGAGFDRNVVNRMVRAHRCSSSGSPSFSTAAKYLIGSDNGRQFSAHQNSPESTDGRRLAPTGSKASHLTCLTYSSRPRPIRLQSRACVGTDRNASTSSSLTVWRAHLASSVPARLSMRPLGRSRHGLRARSSSHRCNSSW